MRSLFFLPRFFALWLTLSLALPAPSGRLLAASGSATRHAVAQSDDLAFPRFARRRAPLGCLEGEGFRQPSPAFALRIQAGMESNAQEDLAKALQPAAAGVEEEPISVRLGAEEERIFKIVRQRIMNNGWDPFDVSQVAGLFTALWEEEAELPKYGLDQEFKIGKLTLTVMGPDESSPDFMINVSFPKGTWSRDQAISLFGAAAWRTDPSDSPVEYFTHIESSVNVSVDRIKEITGSDFQPDLRANVLVNPEEEGSNRELVIMVSADTPRAIADRMPALLAVVASVAASDSLDQTPAAGAEEWISGDQAEGRMKEIFAELSAKPQLYVEVALDEGAKEASRFASYREAYRTGRPEETARIFREIKTAFLSYLEGLWDPSGSLSVEGLLDSSAYEAAYQQVQFNLEREGGDAVRVILRYSPTPAAGVEEVVKAIQAAVALLSQQEVLLSSLVADEIMPVSYFESSPEMAELKRLEIEPLVAPTKLNASSAVPMPSTIRLLVQEGYQGQIEGQMAGVAVELVTDPALADFVIGDAAFVKGQRALSEAAKAFFLQVEDRSFMERITPLLLAHILNRRDLFPQGTVLLIGLKVQGEFGEGLLLFA